MLDDGDKGWIAKQFAHLMDTKCGPRGEELAYMRGKIDSFNKTSPYNADKNGQPKDGVRKNGHHITVTGTARAFAVCVFILISLIMGYIKLEQDRTQRLKASIVREVVRSVEAEILSPE